jgi:hypothetical protein
MFPVILLSLPVGLAVVAVSIGTVVLCEMFGKV